MAISLRVSPQEQTLIENYARVHGISVSETLRKAFFEMIEDEIDLEYCLKSITSYEASGKAYTLDELDEEFDHRCPSPYC